MANLEKADLTGANLANANIAGANLDGADMPTPSQDQASTEGDISGEIVQGQHEVSVVPDPAVVRAGTSRDSVARESPEVQQPTSRKMSVDEANAKAMRLARADADFLNKSQREWAKAIGCSEGLVGKLPLWKGTMEKTSRGRKGDNQPAIVALTDKLIAATPCYDNDPADTVGTDEIMQRLIDHAKTTAERDRLLSMTPAQRRPLANQVVDQESELRKEKQFKHFGRRKTL